MVAVLNTVAAIGLLLGHVSSSPLTAHNGMTMISSRAPVSGAPEAARHAVAARNRPDAIPSAATLDKFRAAQVGDHFVEGDTIFIFRGLGAVDEDDNKLHGRACCGCAPTYYTAVQVPSGQSGTWWGSWEPASGCTYTSGGASGCATGASVQRTWWSDDGGFDTSTADAVVAYINSHGDLSQGHSWATQNTATTNTACCTGTNSVAQIWSQSLWGWSNSQEQSCSGNVCGGPTNCGAWSAYQHANWALGVDGSTINWGCSTGSGSVQC